MKYIVYWVLVSIVPTVCPNAGIADEFGRMLNSGTICSVNHVEVVKEDHSKVFHNRDSAFQFYQRAKVKPPYSFYDVPEITNVKLDSIK